ncbi:hypothetical protein PoB_006447800 [Plakobranchus ocellatus]|uniref:Uncharacterized protein n=1 Tax=Plakobranchus ocellatus TaxID=259542 RepID=A0AAV4D1R2_9GAST|nr:hypothetical protein PoB_006447800 [Plakobranchus ocellatus]
MHNVMNDRHMATRYSDMMIQQDNYGHHEWILHAGYARCHDDLNMTTGPHKITIARLPLQYIMNDLYNTTMYSIMMSLDNVMNYLHKITRRNCHK